MWFSTISLCQCLSPEMVLCESVTYVCVLHTMHTNTGHCVNIQCILDNKRTAYAVSVPIFSHEILQVFLDTLLRTVTYMFDSVSELCV